MCVCLHVYHCVCACIHAYMYAQPVYMYMYIHVHVCVLSQWDECTQSGCNIDHLVSVNTAASKDSSCVRVTQCVCMCVCLSVFLR